jgi:hypothetical protein
MVQQTAQEMNVNTRFGRLELAGENVAPNYRARFAETRKDWGNAVRVADTELAGLQMKTPQEALVMVRVAWRDEKGRWLLTSEERGQGDLGLMGEHIEMLTPDGPRQHAQFPTVRLGAD